MRGALAAGVLLMALIAAPAALAQEAPGRLAVIGRASVVLPPDFATVEVGVETQALSAAGALDGNAAAARRVIEAVRAAGVAAADVATAAVSLQPETRAPREGTPAVVSYRALNTVSVRVRALDGLGGVLRRVVDAGGNRIGGIGFGLADPEKARDEAQAAALQDARRQAEGLAGAAGVTLGAVETIVSPAASGGGVAPLAMRAARAKAPVPITAGTVTLEADVAVTWRIAKP